MLLIIDYIYMFLLNNTNGNANGNGNGVAEVSYAQPNCLDFWTLGIVAGFSFVNLKGNCIINL